VVVGIVTVVPDVNVDVGLVGGRLEVVEVGGVPVGVVVGVVLVGGGVEVGVGLGALAPQSTVQV
jgi:hypothetical protein